MGRFIDRLSWIQLCGYLKHNLNCSMLNLRLSKGLQLHRKSCILKMIGDLEYSAR